MRGTEITYAEFLYGSENGEYSLSEEEKAILADLLQQASSSTKFDANDGDIIITFIHTKRSTTFNVLHEKGIHSITVAYQTNQNPSCDIFETIPA